MTATLAFSGVPSYALKMWSDDNNIYMEVPTNGGVPYITKFPLSEGGLSKALHCLRKSYEEAPMAQKNYLAMPKEIVPKGYVCESAGASVTYRRQAKVVQTDAQRAAALNVLRKRGIV